MHAALAAAEASADLAGESAAGTNPAAPEDDEELAELNRALTAADARMRATLTQARRTLRDIRAAARQGGEQQADDAIEHDSQQSADEDDDAPVAGLLELRADPLGADIRILFAVEPPGTATLLAVLDGADAISCAPRRGHRAGRTIADRDPRGQLAAGRDREHRERRGLHSTTRPRSSPDSFPDRGAAIRARAAELADIGTLAGLRRDRELTIADVAAQRRPRRASDLGDRARRDCGRRSCTRRRHTSGRLAAGST